jgi:hypothetical protein
LSGKKKNFKEMERDNDLILSEDILNGSEDELNWWEIINDSASNSYGNEDYDEEKDRYDEYDTSDQNWIEDWIRNN